MFTLQIKTDNAAFQDDERNEITRILRDLANRIEQNIFAPATIKLRGINENTVGEVAWSDD